MLFKTNVFGSGAGLLLVETVMVMFSFGIVSMERFCRRNLVTKVKSMHWQHLLAIAGYSLLVLMVRYWILFLF